MENKNFIIKSVFGSHLYGTDTPESDRDYKGIFIPSMEDCVLNQIKNTICFFNKFFFSSNIFINKYTL